MENKTDPKQNNKLKIVDISIAANTAIYISYNCLFSNTVHMNNNMNNICQSVLLLLLEYSRLSASLLLQVDRSVVQYCPS